jgi:hypothetical protein
MYKVRVKKRPPRDRLRPRAISNPCLGSRGRHHRFHNVSIRAVTAEGSRHRSTVLKTNCDYLKVLEFEYSVNLPFDFLHLSRDVIVRRQYARFHPHVQRREACYVLVVFITSIFVFEYPEDSLRQTRCRLHRHIQCLDFCTV